MRAAVAVGFAQPGYGREQRAAEALVRAEPAWLRHRGCAVAPGNGERVDAGSVREDGRARGVGNGGWEGEDVRTGSDVNDSVQGVEVGWEGLVVLPRGKDELGKSLDGVWRVFGKEGGECASYGAEKVFDLSWEGARWVLDVWRRRTISARRRILLVGGLGGGGTVLAGGFCYLRR